MLDEETLHSPSPPSKEPGTVLLETERLIIRRYRLSDAPVLAEGANSPEVAAQLRNRFPSPYNLSDAESFLKMATEPHEAAYPEHNGIFVKPKTPGHPSDEELFIGGIGTIPRQDVYYRTWEVGYWLRRPAWGQGYATEAVEAFIRWLFVTWPGLNRLEAATYSRNIQSQNVLRKCGFVEEGRKREAIEKNGEMMDEIILGLLRSEAEAV